MHYNVNEDREVYENLLAFICDQTGIEFDALRKRRIYPFPLFRYGAISYLREKLDWGWGRIERATGLSHVTAIYGSRNLYNLFQTGNKEAKYIIELINNYHHA